MTANQLIVTLACVAIIIAAIVYVGTVANWWG